MSAFAASVAGHYEEVGGAGHVLELQPAMSVPEHMLLGRSPPPARAHSMFTGPTAPRAPRMSLGAARNSDKGLEQAPEPSVGAPLLETTQL